MFGKTSLALVVLLSFSEPELTFTFAICCRPSVCRLSVCRLSVTFVHPTQAVEIFLRHMVPWPSVDIHETFYGDRPRGTSPSEELSSSYPSYQVIHPPGD